MSDSVIQLDDVYRDFNATIAFIRFQNRDAEKPVRLVLIKRGRKDTYAPHSCHSTTGDRPTQQVDDTATRTEQHLDRLTGGAEIAIPEAFSDWQFGVCCVNGVLDVDYDGTSPQMAEALSLFLPPTPHRWGRKGRWVSHYLYLCPDASGQVVGSRVLRAIRRVPAIATEIRAGIDPNIQTVLPGAVSPAKSLTDSDVTTELPVSWHDRDSAAKSPLVRVKYDDILSAIRKAAAAATLAEYWIEGSRNELLLAFTGFMYRLHSLTEDDSTSFDLSRDVAWSIIYATMTIAGDEDRDHAMRKRSFNSTWDKAEKGTPVTGATRIEEITGDPEIKRRLYSILSDHPDMQALEEFLDRFAIWQGPGAVIDLDWIRSGHPKPFMKKQDFVNSHGHVGMEIAQEGKLKRIALADHLFKMKHTKRYAGLTFEPGEAFIVDDKIGQRVNQWRGFAIPPHPSPVEADDIAPFIKHVWEIIANQDQASYDWVMNWMANIFQTPGDRSRTALVLVGKQGAGKSFLGHSILIPIIGRAHSISTGSVQHLIKDFNNEFDSKIFVQCDEAMSNRQVALANRMKALITDPEVRFEPKGFDATVKPNHMRFLFTSNQIEDAVFLNDGDDDRRYTILEVSPRYKNNISGFWSGYVEWTRDEVNLSKIHRYLLDWPLDPNLIAQPLKTGAKRVMQQHSWDIFYMWLASRVTDGHLIDAEHHTTWWQCSVEDEDRRLRRDEWPTRIHAETLEICFNEFARKNSRYQHTYMNGQQIMERFRNDGLAPSPKEVKPIRKQTDQGRKYLRAIHPRHMFAKFLFEKFGYDLESQEKDAIEADDKKSSTKEKF